MRNFLWRFDHFWSQDKGLSSLLVILCLILFVFHPLSAVSKTGEILINVFFTLLLISGVVTVMHNRTWIATVVVFAVLVFFFSWFDLFSANRLIQVTNSVLSIVFYALLGGMVLNNVFKAGPVTAHRIQGAIVVYLLTGLVMAFAYQAIYYARPDTAFGIAARAKSHFSPESEFLYFSFVTLTTVGYGDITPLHPLAQSLVMVEGLIGQLYPAILIARLIGLTLK
ncbi:MAG TPA: potassium channel family protein [Cytophagales bacterium]|jgi:hypothetical protein